jgi:hypothetical protein
MTDRTPSRNGIGSGLHIGPRPEREAEKNGSITTQNPSTSSPSKRGYA